MTLRLFLLQVLSGNTAITHLRQLSGIDFAPSSYCEARLRLPLRLLRLLLNWTVEQAQSLGDRAIGPRVLVVDASTHTSLHPTLRAGDILLGDRAFCSFAHFALLNARGVFACFRLHQRRPIVRGQKQQRWTKPQRRPAWLDPGLFESMPPWLDVRIVRFICPSRGFRVNPIYIATTLPKDKVWTDAKIAELYGHR